MKQVHPRFLRVRINPSILVDDSEFHFDFETRGASRARMQMQGVDAAVRKFSIRSRRRPNFRWNDFRIDIFRVCQRVVTRLYYVFITHCRVLLARISSVISTFLDLSARDRQVRSELWVYRYEFEACFRLNITSPPCTPPQITIFPVKIRVEKKIC